jgi:hypothetical protein
LTQQYGVTIIWVKTQYNKNLALQPVKKFAKRRFFIPAYLTNIELGL